MSLQAQQVPRLVPQQQFKQIGHDVVWLDIINGSPEFTEVGHIMYKDQLRHYLGSLKIERGGQVLIPEGGNLLLPGENVERFFSVLGSGTVKRLGQDLKPVTIVQCAYHPGGDEIIAIVSPELVKTS